MQIATLSTAQKTILTDQARWKLVRASRRFGKTYLAACWLLQRAGKMPGSKHWFVALTQKSAREIVWGKLLDLIPPNRIKSKSEQKLEIVLTNKSIIALRGVDVPDNLRGSGLDSIVCEEYAFWPDDIFNRILRPQLADTLGHAMFISSPNGHNHFYELEEKLKLDSNAKVYHYTIYDSMVAKDEIEELKRITPSTTWKSEYLAEYLDEVGKVYHEFKQSHIGTVPPPYNYVCRGMDWGLNDYTACVWLCVKEDIIYAAKEHVLNNTPVSIHAEHIKRIDKNFPIIHNTVLDASCWKREGTTLTSIADEFKKHGIYVNQASRQKDTGISVVKELFNQNKILINPECTNLLDSIRTWSYDRHEPDSLVSFRYATQHVVEKHILSQTVNVKTQFSDPTKSSLPLPRRRAKVLQFKFADNTYPNLGYQEK